MVVDLVPVLEILSNVWRDDIIFILDVIILLVGNYFDWLIVPSDIRILPSPVALSGVNFDDVYFVLSAGEFT